MRYQTALRPDMVSSVIYPFRAWMAILERFIIIFGLTTAGGFGVYAQGEIAVGSKKFTESYVLSEIAKVALERVGFQVSHREGMGGTVILWQALLHGDIAFYPEYTGTIAQEILKMSDLTEIGALREALASRGIGVSGDLGFGDNYALAMKRSRAESLGIATLSDLKRHPDLRAGPTPEFLGRQDGWRPLTETYGLSFASVRGIEHALGYAALASGQIDIKECYTTDAKIAELDLVTLTDDLQFFPQYRAVFLYRLDTAPEAVRAVESLSGTIDENRMIALNRIAEETKNYAAAAKTYFQGSGEPKPGRTERDWFAPLPRLTVQHLTLVAVSLLGAMIVGIPLGVAASRPGFVSETILGASGVIQTIPSLALLALLIPVVGIGQTPAIIALFLYGLLPIVQGTSTGLQAIPRSLGEASEALGLSSWTRLRLIDLPIASPAILAGIKTSAVINVGTATLAGLIGGGGFGEPIQSGLQLNDNATILQGAIPAAVLALAVQALFVGLERVLVSRGLRIETRRASGVDRR